MDIKLWYDIGAKHSGKIIGVLLGFFLSIIIIFFGFFRAMFIIICMVAGYVIGKRIDEKEDIMDILDKLMPPGYRR